MAVVVETTIGDLTIDLMVEHRPRACENFLKLCKLKYYNFSLFHKIQRDFIAQTGDPSGTGTGGTSVFGVMFGDQAKYFEGDRSHKIKHTSVGTVSFASHGDFMFGSQFFFTLSENLEYLDGDHCVFGHVTEGRDVLIKLNELVCDESFHPYQDVRITHTVVLHDPLDDPKALDAPPRSPSVTSEAIKSDRIAVDELVDDSTGLTGLQLEEIIQDREARARATILEMVGDLPDADSAPPENVLFVCKLNPVTTDDDLNIIFSRFGNIVSCEIIKDNKTKTSLQYGFVEFDNPRSCEDAYFKMDNVLIDDRRIHVDFSQSVSKVKWHGRGRVSFSNGTNANQLSGNHLRSGNFRKTSQTSGKHSDNQPRPVRDHRKPSQTTNANSARCPVDAKLAKLGVDRLKSLLNSSGDSESSEDNAGLKKSKKKSKKRHSNREHVNSESKKHKKSHKKKHKKTSKRHRRTSSSSSSS